MISFDTLRAFDSGEQASIELIDPIVCLHVHYLIGILSLKLLTLQAATSLCEAITITATTSLNGAVCAQ